MLLTYPRGSVFWLKPSEAKAIGSEQNGARPVIIISNNKNNMHSPVVTIVPITSKEKVTLPTHVPIDAVTHPYTDINLVLCEQITTVAKQRLSNYIGMLPEDVLKNIEKAVAIQLDLTIHSNTIETTEPIETIFDKPMGKASPGTRGFIGYSDEYKKAYVEDSKRMSNQQLAKKYNINTKAASARKISWAKQFK